MSPPFEMLGPLPHTPFVSAFALTYNHEDYIAEAIESVLAESWPADRFEFVLLDDGSSDATPERVKPYLDHLTYIRQDNQGIHRAVERLMGALSGDVLIPCSGDDAWRPGRIERTVEHLRAHPDVGLLYGDMEVIDAAGEVIAPSFMQAAGFAPHRGQIAGKLLARNFVSGGAIAVRGELLGAILPIPAFAAWEDWWFAWAITNLAAVDYMDQPIYRYRRHGSNFVLGVSDPETLLDRISEEIRFRRYMLGTVRPGTASPAELLAGVEPLRALLGTLLAHGRPLEPILELTDAHRAAARRLAADAAEVARTSFQLASFTAARAAATDPTNEAAYRVLQAVAGPAEPAPQPFADAGSVLVFAAAEELVAHPELLGHYVSAFTAGDDVTLVAVAQAWDAERLAAELGPVAERVAGEDAPDMLALPASPAAWLSGLTRADCVLGLHELPVPGLVRVEDAGALRAHVEQRWRFPLRRS
jgi:glycosyltransferase involved in cell wall biosynthesis